MASTIIREWEVTITITRTLQFPYENFESEGEFRAWLKSEEGLKALQQDFTKGLHLYGYIKNAEIELYDLNIKENQINSWDTDPRV